MIYQEFADFWRQLPVGETVHPADKPILSARRHSLRTELRPAFGAGPLAKARVVLCYLNNKFTEEDDKLGIDPIERLIDPPEDWGEYLAGIIEGRRDPLPFRPWGEVRIRDLDGIKVATFNIVPYRSREFRERSLARRLPSAQMARSYLHNVLLPEAAGSERFVVIVWGAKLWGVEPEDSHDTLAVCTRNRKGYLPDDVKRRIKAWANI